VRLSCNGLVALVLGVALGGALQWGYGHEHAVVDGTMTWVHVVGQGYVRLLQMIVMPLVLVSILSAVTRLDDARSLGRISAGVLGMLMATTAVSALIGVGMARLFGLDAAGLVRGTREIERGEALEARLGEVADLGVPDLLLSFIPTNVFDALTGGEPTSIISIVLFASLLGIAALGLRRSDPELGGRVIEGVETLQALVMRLVRMVIRLTPYGVLALMTRVLATSDLAAIVQLIGLVEALQARGVRLVRMVSRLPPAGVLALMPRVGATPGLAAIVQLIGFVAASYAGLALIRTRRAGALAAVGLSPARFFRRIWPVLA